MFLISESTDHKQYIHVVLNSVIDICNNLYSNEIVRLDVGLGPEKAFKSYSLILSCRMTSI